MHYGAAVSAFRAVRCSTYRLSFGNPRFANWISNNVRGALTCCLNTLCAFLWGMWLAPCKRKLPVTSESAMAALAGSTQNFGGFRPPSFSFAEGVLISCRKHRCVFQWVPDGLQRWLENISLGSAAIASSRCLLFTVFPSKIGLSVCVCHVCLQIVNGSHVSFMGVLGKMKVASF